jgi:hypothetical protein
MSLAASLRHEKATGIRKGPPCQVCLLLDTLTGEDLAELQDALADPAVAHSQIGRALRAEGYKVLNNTISRHRKSECQGR